MRLKVAKVFETLFKFDKRFVYLRGGRVSGKTKVSSQMVVLMTMSEIEKDIIICRDSYSDLANSTYTELRSFIAENDLEDEFEFKVAPLHIHNKRTKANIYFVGIGGADKDRTK